MVFKNSRKLQKSSLMTIGKFAELSDYSVKTIKTLEEKKILLPYYTDPANGYRYYAVKQLLLVNLIKMYQSWGFSFGRIRQILKTRSLDKIYRIYAGKFKTLTAEIERQEGRIRLLEKNSESLRRFNSSVSGEALSIKVRKFEQRTLLTAEQKVSTMQSALNDYFIQLQDSVKSVNARATREYYFIFHDNYANLDPQKAIVTLGYGIDAEKKTAAKEPVMTLPAGLYMTAMYKGTYKDSLALYEIMLQYAEKNGYRISGPVIRQFFFHLMKNDQAGFVNEFQLKVEAGEHSGGQ